MQIIVQRAPADRQGPDISDPLLTAPIAARERGRVEIDRESTDRVLVQITGPYLGWLSPGSLVEYRGRRGSWRGLAWDGFVGAPLSKPQGYPTAYTTLGFSVNYSF